MIEKKNLGSLCLAAIGLAAIAFGMTPAAGAQGTPMEIKPPLGLPAVPVPSDNPMTVEKVELGKMLYFDTRLSQDGSISCSTCHDPAKGYGDNLPTSEGIHKQIGGRNANTVINAAYVTSMFWDGRMKDLEEQAGGPVENPIEMGEDMSVVSKKLEKVPEYKKRFEAVFGTPEITAERIQKAIAAFERTILSGNSPYDKFKAGDESAMSGDAKKGMTLFTSTKFCAVCHTPPTFSSGGFYNTGAGKGKGMEDIGRKEVTKQDSDTGAFRVPSLREIEHTGPYMHDGSIADLREAVTFMASGGRNNPHRFPIMAAMQKPTDEEVDQLVAFLKALSGEYPVVKAPKLPE